MSQENANEILSRNDIISWVNDLLKVNITKVEQLSSGAIYCQILDIIHPGKVPLNKVNWKAKMDYEFVYNFKILQQTFIKLNINKPIDIERLIRSKYQDNFEFISWMKKYFDANTTPSNVKDYNPLTRRNNFEIDLCFLERNNSKQTLGKDSINNKSIFPRNSSRENITSRQMSIRKNNSNLSFLSNKENEMFEKNKEDYKQHMTNDVLKAERDFYFSKLRDVDHLLDNFNRMKSCQELIDSIKNILYMTPEKTIFIEQDGTIRLENNQDNILNLKNVNYNELENYNFENSFK